MLYASTQNALKRALGDYRFKDSIFATSKVFRFRFLLAQSRY